MEGCGHEGQLKYLKVCHVAEQLYRPKELKWENEWGEMTDSPITIKENSEPRTYQKIGWASLNSHDFPVARAIQVFD